MGGNIVWSRLAPSFISTFVWKKKCKKRKTRWLIKLRHIGSISCLLNPLESRLIIMIRLILRLIYSSRPIYLFKPATIRPCHSFLCRPGMSTVVCRLDFINVLPLFSGIGGPLSLLLLTKYWVGEVDRLRLRLTEGLRKLILGKVCVVYQKIFQVCIL